MNQFNRYEKKHIRKSTPAPYKKLLEINPKTASNELWLQFSKAREDYFFWKGILKELNHSLVNLKASKTRHYLSERGQAMVFSDYNLSTINEKLFWWRNYYPKALECYRDAKQDYLDAQRYCFRYTEEQNADRVNAKDFKGKYYYQISVKHGDNWFFVYHVRSNTDYLDENNFKDEFEYELELAVERFGDKLKEYNWNANWELNNILKFYRSADITVTIERVSEADCGDILIDFEEFHAWRKNKSVKEKERLCFRNYVKYKEYSGGAGVCKGFRAWLCDTFRDVLEKQYYGHEASDIIDLYWKRTIHSWDRYFDMWTNNETPEDRRKNKCSK